MSIESNLIMVLVWGWLLQLITTSFLNPSWSSCRYYIFCIFCLLFQIDLGGIPAVQGPLTSPDPGTFAVCRSVAFHPRNSLTFWWMYWVLKAPCAVKTSALVSKRQVMRPCWRSWEGSLGEDSDGIKVRKFGDWGRSDWRNANQKGTPQNLFVLSLCSKFPIFFCVECGE